MTEVMTQPPQVALAPDMQAKLKNLLATIPPDRQLSWLQLCDAKATFLKKLEGKELEAQALLLGYEKSEVLELQGKLEAYRKIVAEMPEIRKGYTVYLDKIKKDMMVPEQRVEASETFALATNHFTTMRLANEAKANEANAKVVELEAFKAHVKNQYARLEASYRIELGRRVTEAYTMALSDANVLSKEAIDKYLELATETLQEVKLIPTDKYDYKIHTKEELTAISATLAKPDWVAILQENIKGLHTKFSMYSHDKANAEAAKKTMQEEQTRLETAIKSDTDSTMAVNTLVGKAGGTQITIGDGVTPIKRKTSIVVRDDDPSWAHKIVTAFLGNWPTAVGYVSIKKWGNLSVSQMASALDKAEIIVGGVDYKEDVK